MSILSNFDSVIAPTLRALGSAANLARSRHGRRRLGDEMADVIAVGVQQRTLAEQKLADGEPIPANRGQYGKRKRNRGIKVGVGFYGDHSEKAGGEMLELEQVRGQVAMNETELVMTAGLDADVQEKIDWFIAGNPATGQPPRDYYQLDDGIERDLDTLVDEAITDRIRDLGGM